MATVLRKLAAILAADVAGYSRLMGDDEAGTLAALKAHRGALWEPAVRARGGRIVATAGDSFVGEFPSVIDAAQCAIEIQAAMARRNDGVAASRRMELRIGVNLGDVMVDGADIYGDGINIAARLQALAEPGAICISDKVYAEIKGKLDAACDDLGPQRFKNIAQPVHAYRLRAGGGAAGRKRPRVIPLMIAATLAALALGVGSWLLLAPDRLRVAPADKPSIAVLPFANMSADSGQDYFSDGLTEDLITDLSKVSGLLVIARNSTFAYKGQAVNVPQVGRELGARYVVEGSVRRAGERIRITAQLIDAASGTHLWAERYDRDIKDIFELQDDVRQKIVAALAVKLTPVEKARLAQRPTASPEAYDLYVRGRERLNAMTRDAAMESIGLLTRATELDPNFARAFAQLASAYINQAQVGWSDDPAAARDRAVAAASRAVALDENLPEARLALCRAYLNVQQVDRALAEIERAIAIDTNYADGYAFRGYVLTFIGRAADAIASVERAVRMNPQFPFWYYDVRGRAEYMLERYEDAVRDHKLALERNPNWSISHLYLVASYGQLGRRDDAAWELAEIDALDARTSIGQVMRSVLLQNDTNRDRLIGGLRKAGMRE
jgi:TolB-like protein/class 3 adenylate cyclase/Flp pilus assembly protein TadD